MEPMTERERCLEELSYTWMCSQCRTYQADVERTEDGTCRTCFYAPKWVEAWLRSLRIQQELRDLAKKAS